MWYLVDVVAVAAGDLHGRGAAREGHGPRLHHELLRGHHGAALRYAALRPAPRAARSAAARAARPVQPHLVRLPHITHTQVKERASHPILLLNLHDLPSFIN